MPGGKVDGDETPEVALAREWKEELGLDIVVGEHIATCGLHLEVSFMVDLYSVSFPPVLQPALLDHDDLTWTSIEHAIEFMPCSPAMYMHYPMVRGWLMRTQPTYNDRKIIEMRLASLRDAARDLDGHGQANQAIVVREDISRLEKRLREL